MELTLIWVMLLRARRVGGTQGCPNFCWSEPNQAATEIKHLFYSKEEKIRETLPRFLPIVFIRIMEWFGFKRTFKGHLVLPPLQ